MTAFIRNSMKSIYQILKAINQMKGVILPFEYVPESMFLKS
jgi:hypothetical protein